jgi:hypothetical protein
MKGLRSKTRNFWVTCLAGDVRTRRPPVKSVYCSYVIELLEVSYFLILIKGHVLYCTVSYNS